MFGVEKFFVFLAGNPFILQTDHKPLTVIFHPSRKLPVLSISRLQRWAMKLMSFQYTVEFRSTNSHCNADALSRLPQSKIGKDSTGHEIFQICGKLATGAKLNCSLSQLQIESDTDEEFKTIKQYLQEAWIGNNRSSLSSWYSKREELLFVNGLLFWNHKICISRGLRHAVLCEMHDGHPGHLRMARRAMQSVWWPGVHNDCLKFTQSCTFCQKHAQKPRNDFVSWPIEDKPLGRIHVDHAGPFLGAYWLLVVDAFSKWPEVVPN